MEAPTTKITVECNDIIERVEDFLPEDIALIIADHFPSTLIGLYLCEEGLFYSIEKPRVLSYLKKKPRRRGLIRENIDIRMAVRYWLVVFGTRADIEFFVLNLPPECRIVESSKR